MRKPLKKSIAALAIGAASVFAVVVGVQPASANSFTHTVSSGTTLQYADGTDTFCSTGKASNRNHLVLTLKPVNGVGPKYTRVISTSKVCWSLARAYEDSRYEWTITVSPNPGFPVTGKYSGRFYS